MTCPQCFSPLPPYSGRGAPRKFCSDSCTTAWHRANITANRVRLAYEPRVCEVCDEQFVPWRHDQRFCGWDCGHKFHRQQSEQKKTPEERWNARRRVNYQRRRALKRGATAGDPVVLDEIRVRDNDRCGICGGRVNGKAWPHPLSASLDHMVPLSEGGAHDPTNVQLAHLQCNVRKGKRGGGEQLRIV